MTNRKTFTVGQRVRIEREDVPSVHIGKLGIVERLEFPQGQEPLCVVRVDRIDRKEELVSLPQRYLSPIITKPSSLLANDLLLLAEPQLKPRMQAFTQNSWLGGHVLETLMFYDHLVIPTVDFSIIVPLVHWLGGRILTEMLRDEVISFVRFAGNLSYIGNGVGLGTYIIRAPEGTSKPEPWWMQAARCSPHEAVILQMKNRYSGWTDSQTDAIARLVEICTIDTALPRFIGRVEEETYRDILGSDVLTAFYGRRCTDLKRLPGLQPNQMRLLSSLPPPAAAGDEIDITLRLAWLNLEAYLAEESGTRDMVTDHGFGSLLSAKLDRYTGGQVAHESFSRLVSIEQLPDLASLINEGEVDLLKVWELRNATGACRFRKWFDEVGPKEPEDLVRKYVQALKAGQAWSSTRAKVIRFLVVQSIGVALTPVTQGWSFIASMGLSAVDCFLLERIRRGYNPRYFVDELRHRLFSD